MENNVDQISRLRAAELARLKCIRFFCPEPLQSYEIWFLIRILFDRGAAQTVVFKT